MNSRLELLGTIVRLQVQVHSLKVGDRPHSGYDPAGIRGVSALRVDQGGVTGLEDGREIGDVHHRDHPQTKFRGENGISIGFTGHYQAMRMRHPHLMDGIAGENILVDLGEVVTPDSLGADVVVRTTEGDIALGDVQWAPPCVEFGKFCNGYRIDQRADTVIADTVRFLSDGIRGYYATLAAGTTGVIRPGDQVFRLAH